MKNKNIIDHKDNACLHDNLVRHYLQWKGPTHTDDDLFVLVVHGNVEWRLTNLKVLSTIDMYTGLQRG